MADFRNIDKLIPKFGQGAITMIHAKHFSHLGAYQAAMHSHPQGQLFVLLQGTALYATEQGEWLITPQRACWVPPGWAHAVTSTNPIAGIVILADESLCQGLPPRIAIMKPNQFLEALLQKMLTRHAEAEALIHLWRVVSDEIQTLVPDTFYLPVPQDERLKILTQFLANHPDDNRPLHAWAEQLHMSERSLTRRFRDETGVSFVAWRQRARIMLAVRLLAEGHRITDTALAVGYNSLSAFIHTFKQIMGCLPADYVKEKS